MKKLRLVALRLLQLVPVLIGISVITFVLAQATPGDPVRLIVGQRATEEVIAAVRQQYGLDEPIFVQYLVYVENLLQGDWGRSIAFRGPVLDFILSRVTPTLYLVVGGLLFTILPALLLAVIAAYRQDSWIDQLIRIFYTVGLGLPSFWVALVLVLILAVHLDWFPATGFGQTFGERLYHLVLPWTAISTAMTPILLRNLRSGLLDRLHADFVVSARSKGLPERYIFLRHVLPNSILPSLHLLGVVAVWTLGFAIIIEPIFAIPGLGQLFLRSILGRDYFVMQGLTLVFAMITVLITLAVDLLTLVVDPRVS